VYRSFGFFPPVDGVRFDGAFMPFRGQLADDRSGLRWKRRQVARGQLAGCLRTTTLRLRMRKVMHMAVIQLHRCKRCGKTWVPPASWRLKICHACKVARTLRLAMRKVEHPEVIQMHRCNRCGKTWFPRTGSGAQTERLPALSPSNDRTMCQQCANVEAMSS
jgi:hypothetical protein